MPVGWQWFFGICSFVAIVLYLAEKIPRVRQYLKTPADGRPPRSRGDVAVGSGLAVVCAGIWAASYASLGVVSKSASTLQINVYLMGFASAFLFTASLITRRRDTGMDQSVALSWRSGRGQILVAANLGNFLLSVFALTFISVSEAMTLINLAPLLLAIALWFRGRLHPSFGTLLAVALIALGILLVNMDSGFKFHTGRTVIGSLIAIGAAGAFALWTFNMDELRVRMTSLAVRLRTLALVFFVSYAILVTVDYAQGSSFDPSPRDLWILAGNGLRVAIVYLLFQISVERAGPLLASVTVVLMVPFTFPFDRIWNRASLSPQLLLGAILIVLAAVGLLGDELRRVGPSRE